MTRGDRWLLILLVILSLTLLAWKTWGFHSTAQQVQVFQAGEKVMSLNLQEQKRHLVQLSLPGGVATLEVKEGAVRLVPTNDQFCPEQICIRTGWIKKPGESIICAPNQLVIRIMIPAEERIDAVIR